MWLLPRKRFAVIFTCYVILLLPLSSGNDDTNDEDSMCDLNTWYQEAEADGAFVDPEPEISAIETEIISTLEAEGEDYQVPCSLLNGYDELIYGPLEEEGEEEEGGQEEEEEGEQEQEAGADDEGDDLFNEGFGDKNEKKKETIEEKPTPKKETPASNDTPIKSETNLEPEKNVKVGKDIPEEKEAQDVIADIKVGRPSRSKCTVSSQRYQGVLNGCHCSKDSCSWSEIFLTRQGHARSNVEELTHVPKTPKTASSPPNLNQDTEAASQISESKRQLEELTSAYNNKLQGLELQILKLENRMLSDRADKSNDSAAYAFLENQVLKLENELLRINASFMVLVAENSQLRDKVNSEHKGQYPALPDKNSTIMTNLITDHQSRISELSNVITKQNDIIKTLDEKSQLLDEQNSQLKENIVSQSDMIESIMKHIGEIRDMQAHHKSEMDKERRDIYNVISSFQDKDGKERYDGQKDLNPPNTLGGPSDQQKTTTGNVDASIEFPGGNVHSEMKLPVQVQEKSMPENPKLPTAGKDKESKATAVKEKEEEQVAKEDGKDDKTILKDGGKSDVSKAADKVETNAEDKPAGASPKKIIKGKKGAIKKGKKKVLKTKGKKVAKKNTQGKRKVVKKMKTEKVIPVPPAMYLDPDYKGMKDCYSHFVQGRKRDSPLRIRPVGLAREADVFCDMKNGGWTTIMRRQDGATDFYRDWAEYKRGFGGTYTDHWLGLDLIHRLTNQGDYQLRVDLTDWQRNSVHAIYDLFRVEGESEGYRLYISGYSGTAGDGFLGHNGMKFSTKDKDNDQAVRDFGGSCAQRFHGAWWYNKCYKSNLTGKYYRGGEVAEGQFDGVSWKAWTGSKISLKKVELKIRPKL